MQVGIQRDQERPLDQAPPIPAAAPKKRGPDSCQGMPYDISLMQFFAERTRLLTCRDSLVAPIRQHAGGAEVGIGPTPAPGPAAARLPRPPGQIPPRGTGATALCRAVGGPLRCSGHRPALAATDSPQLKSGTQRPFRLLQRSSSEYSPATPSCSTASVGQSRSSANRSARSNCAAASRCETARRRAKPAMKDRYAAPVI